MSSLADRLAAASRDRATLPTTNDAMASMSKAQRRGKEHLQAQALSEVRAVLKGEGAPDKVEAVYFTSLVTQ